MLRLLEIAAVVALLGQISVRAPAGDKLKAHNHFNAGLTLIKAEDFDSAAVELRRSIEVFPTKSAYYNLANCYRALHRYGDSLDIFNILLTDYREDLSKEMRQDIKQQIDEINDIVARFTVMTNLPGALVQIDGERIGKTPLAHPVVLAPGSYEVTISLSGYETIEHNLNVTSGAETSATFELKEARAEIVITTDEPGASVVIDGEPRGVTPSDDPIPLSQGTHEITVSKPGFGAQTKTIILSKGERRTLTLSLKPVGEDAASHPSKGATTDSRERQRRSFSPVFWVGVAGTVAMGGVAGAMWGITLSKKLDHDDAVDEYNLKLGQWNLNLVEDQREESALDSRIDTLKKDVHKYNRIATGFSIATGAFLAVMVVGVFVGRGDGNAKSEKKVSLLPAPNGLRMTF